MRVHLTMKSGNEKTGPIPVSTTERDSCPDDCAMKGECYGLGGPLAIHWRAVSEGLRGMTWDEFCERIAALPLMQLWRHNQAGDLPKIVRADGTATVDRVKLQALVVANNGRRGFTYSHHRDADSIDAIRDANRNGFTVNLSANDLADADMLADYDAGPVTVILASTVAENTVTPAGRPVVVCPATIRDVSCDKCQLCARRERTVIVGFPAHGSRRGSVDRRLAAAA